MSLTAGIFLDPWKIPVFREYLDAAGYSYVSQPDFVRGVMVLKVKCEDTTTLAMLVKSANDECDRIKRAAITTPKQ